MDLEDERSYRVHLAVFEGPLDLLLHLVRENKVEIWDIPLAELTGQYLTYLEQLDEVELEVAGDYLVMAATLVRWKARRLLPARTSGDAEDDEGADPAEELARRLAEYTQFKEAAAALSQASTLWKSVVSRSEMGAHPPIPEKSWPDPAGGITPSGLMDALLQLLSRQADSVRPRVLPVKKWDVQARMRELGAWLRSRRSANFEELLGHDGERAHVIISFLSVLEFMRRRQVKAFQHELFGTIHLEWIDGNEKGG